MLADEYFFSQRKYEAMEIYIKKGIERNNELFKKDNSQFIL